MAHSAVPLKHAHPSTLTPSPSRQYATFFLGWLFILSQILFLTSPTLTSIILRLTRAHNPLNVETRSTTNASAEKSIPTTTSSSRSDSLALVLLLNLLILTTSATQFASLLAFNSSNGETSCVFLTAWNGLGETLSHIILRLSDLVPPWCYFNGQIHLESHRCSSRPACRVFEAWLASERAWYPQVGKLAAMGAAPLFRCFDVSHERREYGYPPAHPRRRRAFLL